MKIWNVGVATAPAAKPGKPTPPAVNVTADAWVCALCVIGVAFALGLTGVVMWQVWLWR